MFSAESTGTNSKSQKWKTKKFACPFLIALFYFETNLIKYWFFVFSGPVWTAGKFFPSWSEAEKLACSDKKNFLLRNLLPRVLFFYIRPKSRLKNRVTIVHLLQCKTNLFILLCFWGRNLRELKNIHLGRPPLISKNFFLDSVTPVYIHLHSSTFV